MMELNKRIENLALLYGDGADGACPTPAQWRALIDKAPDGGVTLINFFKMREEAVYPAGSETATDPGTGDEAFQRYAAVSGGVLEKVGGHFMLVAPCKGSLVGEDESWDLIAIGTYPDVDSVLALFEDEDYRRVYGHRTAACARQKVFFC